MEWKIRPLWLYEHLLNWSVASYLFSEPIVPQSEDKYQEQFLQKYRSWDHRYIYLFEFLFYHFITVSEIGSPSIR